MQRALGTQPNLRKKNAPPPLPKRQLPFYPNLAYIPQPMHRIGQPGVYRNYHPKYQQFPQHQKCYITLISKTNFNYMPKHPVRPINSTTFHQGLPNKTTSSNGSRYITENNGR
ncbi:unnamed protein product, partial [Ceratitis capitata]